MEESDTRTAAAEPARKPELGLFDLDHTLLSGDSDQLWCDFLAGEGLIDAAARKEAFVVAERYAAGTMTPPEYCGFFAAILRGRTQAALLPVRERFLEEVIRPLIPADARSLLQRHRDAGDTLVLTTATNRVVSELTAADLGVDHYVCTELEYAAGRLTGRVLGVPNMGTGKLGRLREWLAANDRGPEALRRATFYTDSINDLALLSVVGRPIVVDPDPRLESAALRKRWRVIRLDRSRAPAPGPAHAAPASRQPVPALPLRP
jgi:HAD superfamily hydrolase (TIGR01490 family)